MIRDEKWKQELSREYREIPVPEALEEKVKTGILQGKMGADEKENTIQSGEHKKKQNRTKKIRRWSAGVAGGVAAAMLAVTVLGNVSASFAYACYNVPVLGSFVRAVTSHTYEEDQGEITAKVTVPQVESEDKSTDTINQEIKKYTDQVIRMFKEDVKSTDGKGREHVVSDYKVILNTDRLFSLKLHVTVSMNTSSDETRIYHLDKKTGKTIVFKDLFNENSDYLQILTDEIRRQMRDEMKKDSQKMYFIDQDNPGMEWEGLDDKTQFYISDKGQLVIVFDKYQVAPGYMGSCSFTVPDSCLDKVLRDEWKEIIREMK